MKSRSNGCPIIARTLVISAFAILAAIPAGAAIKPMTLISTGKPCFVSTGNNAVLFDRDLTTRWDCADSSWIAVKVGSGYSKLLLHWIPYEFASWIPYWEDADSTGAPGDYQILVSNNSTNGQDGTWSPVVTVTGNHDVSRMHSFNFTGQEWVKFRTTARTWRKNAISLAEIEIFDVSNGIEDTWIFVGNSITSGAFHNRITPSFAQDIAALHPGYQPAMINGGHSGARVSEGTAEIDDRLAMNPDVHFWCLEYGTNDSRDGYDTLVFRKSIDTMITKIMAAGHVPMLAQVPWSVQNYSVTPKYSRQIDFLNAKYSLLPGPDLFAWFKAHPTELKQNDVHPNDTGDVSMNRLWAQAVASLYSTTVASGRPYATSVSNGKAMSVSFDRPGMARIYSAGRGKLLICRLDGSTYHTVSMAGSTAVGIALPHGAYIFRFTGRDRSETERVLIK
jgi:acyl-CoA thioesterase I